MLISYLLPKGLGAPKQCCVLLIWHFLNVFGLTPYIILRQAEYVNTEICNFLHLLLCEARSCAARAGSKIMSFWQGDFSCCIRDVNHALIHPSELFY